MNKRMYNYGSWWSWWFGEHATARFALTKQQHQHLLHVHTLICTLTHTRTHCVHTLTLLRPKIHAYIHAYIHARHTHFFSCFDEPSVHTRPAYIHGCMGVRIRWVSVGVGLTSMVTAVGFISGLVVRFSCGGVANSSRWSTAVSGGSRLGGAAVRRQQQHTAAVTHGQEVLGGFVGLYSFFSFLWFTQFVRERWVSLYVSFCLISKEREIDKG